ncbi:unnamed protein product [Ectocarpus sp. CCAP 1310/34]|nr:unnamed protein product [Ectocarpus sp. CCAP 1310/34]
MSARMRMDDGELSDWFSVTQGVRPGCVLSPQLFKIYFAEVLEAVLIRFGPDDVVLRSLVCLEEGKTAVGAGDETILDLVRRAVRGIWVGFLALGNDVVKQAPPSMFFFGGDHSGG